MQRESINRKTFAKGIGAVAVAAAASIGALQYAEYSTASASYSFVPGTYTASAKGMESDISVTITVDDSAITDVSIDVSGETKGIGADIGDEVTQQILSAQSASIDGVTGATVSSTAVKTALEEALAKAENGDAEAAEAVSEKASETETGTSAASGSYTPGTYTATAKGIESDVTVTGTFDASSLTDVSIDVSGETKGIGAEVGDPMKEKFLTAQSADVDAESGATVTSDAVKKAMADVFAQASGSAPSAEAVTEGTDAESGATAEAVTEGSDDAIVSYVPGTYKAQAKGMDGNVSVEATFSRTRMTDLKIDVSGETAGIGAEIGDEMTEKFLQAQSADVDAASGATVTSKALMKAVSDVISQAQETEAVSETK